MTATLVPAIEMACCRFNFEAGSHGGKGGASPIDTAFVFRHDDAKLTRCLFLSSESS